jgi:DNA-binding response OmpR family regulator
MGRSTVLVVEEDRAIRAGVVDALTLEGYLVLEAGDGKTGLELATSATYDLVLLDLVLPHHSGFDILAALREYRPGTPVIVMSARGAESDRVRGLKEGADDYVVKPFGLSELLARVEAVLRRSPERPEALAEVPLPQGVADLRALEVRFDNGERAELSSREVDILRYLAGRRGRPVSRDELLRRVWRVDPSRIETRTIDMHIAHLRGKIRDRGPKPQVLVTVRGKGYMLVKESLA